MLVSEKSQTHCKILILIFANRQDIFLDLPGENHVQVGKLFRKQISVQHEIFCAIQLRLWKTKRDNPFSKLCIGSKNLYFSVGNIEMYRKSRMKIINVYEINKVRIVFPHNLDKKFPKFCSKQNHVKKARIFQFKLQESGVKLISMSSSQRL